MKLCMIGTGYVGLVSGVCFSDLGNDVICVDKDIDKINDLKNGIIPIYEPGLEELLIKNYKIGRLKFSTNIKESVSKSDVVFICVGTPTNKNGTSADLSQVYSVAKKIRNSIDKFKIIITKSTVPVTTGDLIEKIISQKKSKKLFSIVSNPEFLREGEAIRDFIYPDRIVIGTNDKKTNKILKNLYSPLISKGAKYINTSRRAAELIKYASNAFLATKITFINEIANLCENINVNVEDIAIGMGLDKRIGGRFLRAGPAYGGSCFPKDTKAISATGDKFKTNLSVIKSVIKSNENRSSLLLKRVFKLLNNNIKNKKISFLGVTFKANTDDMRDSSSLLMIPALSKKGAKINYYDPTGIKSELNKFKNVNFSNNIKSAISDSDLIIIHTEWNDFKSINFKKISTNKNFKIFDMRNIYSPIKMKELKIKYFGVGS
ncbi:UDP-glucose/GDP-mannose dehydrogenase family protein [Candidatus Pelagibacter sp.]|jgi:UDPglucose 6-dehydrogenase|nr:UDP-glucose/GDP-mannose dehydrogenase family protein [Candidatus Pelagibacter sp.]|tara:strand:- start:917 stop:2215 length:1299 start_codon:yes stop_codon:yes gene_type:complete